MFLIRIIIVAISCLSAHASLAAETKLTVPMDYSLLRNVLVKEFYTRDGTTLRAWKDGKECSFLDLTNPEITSENAKLKLDNDVHARIGVSLMGKCLPAVEWRGHLQSLQQPTLDNSHKVLTFPVTQIKAFDNNQQLNIKELQTLIDQVVQPKLADLKIDLLASQQQLIKTLAPFISDEDSKTVNATLASLRFDKVVSQDQELLITMSFTNNKVKSASVQNQAVFNQQELNLWHSVWNKLQQTLENGLKQPPLSKQSEEDLQTLQEVLQAAGQAFSTGLTAEDLSDDPVREYLETSWDKLAPLLRKASKPLAGTQGLEFLTLISATDVMVQLDNITAPLGFDISANGLRKVVRAYLAHQPAMP